MPFPNEHAARLHDPADFDPSSFRRVSGGTIYGSKKIPAGVDVIWGKLKTANKPSDNPIPQTLRFAADKWTAAAARKWVKDNNITILSFEPATGEETRESIAEAVDAAKLSAETDVQLRGMVLRLAQWWGGGNMDREDLAAALLAVVAEHARRGLPLRLKQGEPLNDAAKELAQRTGRTDLMRFFESEPPCVNGTEPPEETSGPRPFVYVPAYLSLVDHDGQPEIWVKEAESSPRVTALDPFIKGASYIFEPRGPNVDNVTLCDLVVAPMGWAPHWKEEICESSAAQTIAGIPPLVVVAERYATAKDDTIYVADSPDFMRDKKLVETLGGSKISYVESLPPVEVGQPVLSLCLVRNVESIEIRDIS